MTPEVITPSKKSPHSVHLEGFLVQVALLMIVVWGLVLARPFLVPVLLAALLAFIVTPLVRLFRRIGLPDALAIALAGIVFAIPFAFTVLALVREAQSLIADWPSIVAGSKSFLEKVSHSSWALRFHLDDDLNLPALEDTVMRRAGEGVQFALVGLSALLDASSLTFLIIMFTILMVAIREQLASGAEAIIARTSPAISAQNLIREVSDLIQSFLVARFVITLVVGALAAVILMIFGVNYAILLGVILGVSTLIPNIGFALGIIPPLVIASIAGHSFLNVASLFGVFMILAVLEGNVLTPKLVGGKLNINSLTAFLGLFAGGLMWGVWGMLLSIPLLGVVRICLSLSVETRPWAELIAEREDASLLRRLLPTVKQNPRSNLAVEKVADGPSKT